MWGLEPIVGYGMTIASLRAVPTDRNNLRSATEWP
jgi:hypothetical protein